MINNMLLKTIFNLNFRFDAIKYLNFHNNIKKCFQNLPIFFNHQQRLTLTIQICLSITLK